MRICIWAILSFFIIGCGGGGGSETTTALTTTGLFIDSSVEGVEYSSMSATGTTDSNGYFKYNIDEEVTFKLGNVTLGKAIPNKTKGVVTPLELVGTSSSSDARVVNILRTLQTLDSDNDPINGITIDDTKRQELKETIDLSKESKKLNDDELANLLHVEKNKLVTEEAAKQHFDHELIYRGLYEDELARHNQDPNSDSSSNNNGGTTTSPVTNGEYALLAWNDLGMHCMDGKDFSTFTILPPYNNLNAQLIQKVGTSDKHITSGITMTYEALDYLGHVNTESASKTNFWDYSNDLFPGSNLPVDMGLTGNKTPSLIPQPLEFSAANNWFEALGIPIMNYDDNGVKNYYPMVRVSAKDVTGAILATADVVLPVSDEMDCAKCHASTVSSNAAKPSSGWVGNSDALKDYKLNILRLHDQKYPNAVSDHQTALSGLGYANYDNAGLEVTANGGTPILCATCHKSNALATTGFAGVKSLTEAIHAKHSDVTDPANGLTLNNSNNRTSCYSCHPGAATECLRGAMGAAKDGNGNQVMECQSCHGTISDVGNSAREGWLEEPNCQACHENGNRHTSALVNGTLRSTLDGTFATKPNTPVQGKSLYRYSTGHGDLQCSACHGSTHAIYPSSHAADNLLSTALQGHAGTVAECTSCHTTVPTTTNEGPHGMHSVGQSWVNSHENAAKDSSQQCSTCHGSDSKGSFLSETFSNRSFNAEEKTKIYNKGDQVSCYDCHNGPNG